MTLEEIADRRSPLSLASQVVYQAKVLAMLRELAKADCGPQICELLLNPAAMAKAYAEAYGTYGEPLREPQPIFIYIPEAKPYVVPEIDDY